jgi:hypothetical protein
MRPVCEERREAARLEDLILRSDPKGSRLEGWRIALRTRMKRETPAAFQTAGVFLLYRKSAERSTIGTVII